MSDTSIVKPPRKARTPHCKKCGNVITKGDRFCPGCGSSIVKAEPLSDFEIGKIAALDTIKSDFLKWLGAVSLVLAVLGLFGFSKLVESTVSDKVNAAVSNQKGDIERASRDAAAQLGTLKADLDKRASELKQKEDDLDKLIQNTRGNADEISVGLETISDNEVEQIKLLLGSLENIELEVQVNAVPLGVIIMKNQVMR